MHTLKISKKAENQNMEVVRYKSKKIHHQTDIAVKRIRRHASKIGLDIKNLLVMLEIQEKDKFTKSDLMIMDRRLNFLRHIA